MGMKIGDNVLYVKKAASQAGIPNIGELGIFNSLLRPEQSKVIEVKNAVYPVEARNQALFKQLGDDARVQADKYGTVQSMHIPRLKPNGILK